MRMKEAQSCMSVSLCHNLMMEACVERISFCRTVFSEIFCNKVIQSRSVCQETLKVMIIFFKTFDLEGGFSQ